MPKANKIKSKWQKEGLHIPESKHCYGALIQINQKNKNFTYTQYIKQLEKEGVIYAPKRTLQRYIEFVKQGKTLEEIKFRNPKPTKEEMVRIKKHVSEHNLLLQSKTEFVNNVLPLFNFFCEPNSTFARKYFQDCYREDPQEVNDDDESFNFSQGEEQSDSIQESSCQSNSSDNLSNQIMSIETESDQSNDIKVQEEKPKQVSFEKLSVDDFYDENEDYLLNFTQ